MDLNKAIAHAEYLFLRRHLFRIGYHYGTTGQEDLSVLYKNVSDADVKKWHEVFKQRCGTTAAFSFGSGRMALYAILSAMELQQGHEVIIPAYTCSVVPNAILFAGGRPVYAEIETDTFNLDPEDVRRKISSKTRAIILQHTFGIPLEVERFKEFESKWGITLIEDCCHALGAEHGGKPVGSFGTAAFFSSDATKMICTDIGGVATAKGPTLAKKLESVWERIPEMPNEILRRIQRQFRLKHYGTRPKTYWNIGRYGLAIMARASLLFSQTDDSIGLKPTEYPYPSRFPRPMVHVALRQIQDLDNNIAHRRWVVERFQHIFRGYAQAKIPEKTRPSWLRFPLRVKNPSVWRRVFDKYVEIGDWFSSSAYGCRGNLESLGYVPGSCPISENIQRESINLPTHAMVDENMLKFIDIIFKKNKDILL